MKLSTSRVIGLLAAVLLVVCMATNAYTAADCPTKTETCPKAASSEKECPQTKDCNTKAGICPKAASGKEEDNASKCADKKAQKKSCG